MCPPQIGGAFAPPLKDLSRFLQENPEYGVPPEWADVVKQSVSTRHTRLVTPKRPHPLASQHMFMSAARFRRLDRLSK